MRMRCWIVLVMFFDLTACGGGKSVPDVGEISVPTAVPTVTPTLEPMATSVPNILEVVSAMAEARARVEAEVEAEGQVRMTVEQLASMQAEANRHAEAVAETVAKVAIVSAGMEAIDDSTRNLGGPASMAFLAIILAGFVWLILRGDGENGKEGGG